MDIKKSKTSKAKKPETLPQSSPDTRYKAGIIQTADAKLLLPPAIQTKLSALTAKYGIPFDLSNIGLDGKMAENIKALRTIVDMVEGDSKLLPEMLKLVKKLMKSEIKLAQYHRGVVSASIHHQKKIDKYTADIFLKMAGYQADSKKREHRTNVRNQIKEKRTQAYIDYYQNSVFGNESQLIDTEFERLASDNKILTESKTSRIEFNSERKNKINQYVDSAFN
jgi:hypothetical protein